MGVFGQNVGRQRKSMENGRLGVQNIRAWYGVAVWSNSLFLWGLYAPLALPKTPWGELHRGKP